VVAAVVVCGPHVAGEFRDESLVFGNQATVAPPGQNSPPRHPGSISKQPGVVAYEWASAGECHPSWAPSPEVRLGEDTPIPST